MHIFDAYYKMHVEQICQQLEQTISNQSICIRYWQTTFTIAREHRQKKWKKESGNSGEIEWIVLKGIGSKPAINSINKYLNIYCDCLLKNDEFSWILFILCSLSLSLPLIHSLTASLPFSLWSIKCLLLICIHMQWQLLDLLTVQNIP